MADQFIEVPPATVDGLGLKLDTEEVVVGANTVQRQRIRMAATATATLSNVASSATSVTVLAANAARVQATIFNDSTATLYLKFGVTASATSFTVRVPPGAFYELPLPAYTGRIDGIWSAAAGFARATELTP